MKTRTAPFEHFYVAPENARDATKPLRGIDELASNIEAYGLLQPLVAYEGDEGRPAVSDGSRRLAALHRLRNADKQPAGEWDWNAVRFEVIEQSDAAASSLAANTQRVNLGVVDEAVAWNRMSLDGKSIEDIARAFGVTERYVKGRVRLASLHEPILEALRAGEISLDVAQLYAGAHMSRQEKVWKALGKSNRRYEYNVKQALEKNTLHAGDELAKFVGEDAYVAAGGQVEHELFKAADMSRWLNPEIAERVAQEKLKAIAAEIEAEGFLFVEAAIELPSGKYVDGNFGKPRKASAEEKSRLDAIKAREKALDGERDAINAAIDKRLDADPQAVDEPTDAEQERLDAIEAEEDALRAERRRLEAARVTFDDASKQKSGVTITIDADGRPLIKRGVVAPRELKATPAGKSAAKGKAASAKPAAPEPQAPMTNLTHEKTSRIASIIVGRALAARPDVALVAVTAKLARDVFDDDLNGGIEEPLTIKGGGQRPRSDDMDAALLSHTAYSTERQRWLVSLGGVKDLAKLEARMLTNWSQDEVLKLLAFCVGESVSAIEHNAARKYDDDDARAQLATLGRLAGANPAAHFIPDAEYLGGLSRPSLDAAAAELEISTAGAKTKGALAQLIADHAKGGGASAAWVPPLLRTLCGVVEEPKPATKKAAKAKPSSNIPPVKSPAIVKKSAAKKAAPKKATKVKKVSKKPAKAVPLKKAKAA